LSNYIALHRVAQPPSAVPQGDREEMYAK